MTLMLVGPAGRTWPLTDPVTIGRDDTATFDAGVSRTHARVSRSGAAWVIEDLGSTNGTLVNGERVAGRRRVDAGDQIQVGKTLLRVTAPDEPADAQARFLRGLEIFRSGDHERAERELLAATARDDRHAWAWYYVGLTRDRRGDQDAAVEALQRAVRSQPDLKPARDKLLALGGASAVPDRPAEQAPKAKPKPGTLAQILDSNMREGVPERSEEQAPGDVLWAGRRRVLSCMAQPSAWTWIVALACGASLGVAVASGQPGSLAAAAVMVALALDLPSYFLRSATTTYTVYERRIDIRQGIFVRRERSVWLYDVENVEYTRSFWEMLTGDATITLTPEERNMKPREPITLRGPGNYRQVHWLFEQIRVKALVERRAMKNLWV